MPRHRPESQTAGPHKPGEKQESPSVFRVQLPVSVPLVPAQVPPAHAYVVSVRDRVPVSSQVSLNPPQEPQLP